MVIDIVNTIKEESAFVSMRNQTDEWYAIQLFNALYRAVSADSKLRFSQNERNALIALVEGSPDLSSIESLFNPFDIKEATSKLQIKHFPAVYPRISLLVGEATKRTIKFNVVSFNKRISMLKLQKRSELVDQLIAKNMQENMPKEKIEEALADIQNKRIVTKPAIFASKLLKAYMNKTNIDKLMMDTFSTALITGDPCCYIEKNGDYRIIEPNKIFVEFSENHGSYLQNALSIAEIDYLAVPDIIDRYGEFIDDYAAFIDTHVKNKSSFTNHSYNEFMRVDENKYEQLDKDSFVGSYGNPGYDAYIGNTIRVARITFKQYKKVKKINYFIDGISSTKIESEFYKTKREEGETEKIIYIMQYYTGLIIGQNDFYDMRPIENRTITKDGKVINSSGYVGYLQNFPNRKVTTILSISKTFSEIYDLVLSRLLDIISKNIGPVANMDLAKKPKDLKLGEWITYMYRHNIKLTDSFTSGKEGPAKGLLAMNIANPDTASFEMDFTNIINSYLNILTWVTQQIETLTGVSQNRMGSMHQEQLVGVVQQSITQSVLSTEMIFFRHYSFISEVLNNAYYAMLMMLKDNPDMIYGLGLDEVDDAIHFVNELDVLAEIRVTNNAREIDICLKIDNMVSGQLANNMISANLAAKVLEAISSEDKLKILELEELRQMNMNNQKSEQEKALLQEEYQRMLNTEMQKIEMNKNKDMELLIEKGKIDYDKMMQEIEGKQKELQIIVDKDLELMKLKIESAEKIAEKRPKN